MCRHASRELPPEPRSASVARAFLRECFTDWDLMELYDDAALALTELVANAVMHAATPLVVAISCEGGMVEIAVHDGNPSMPAIRPHRTDIEGDIRQALAAEAAAALSPGPSTNVIPASTSATPARWRVVEVCYSSMPSQRSGGSAR